MKPSFTLLVVDDDAVDRLAVRRALRAAELPVELREAEDASRALMALAAGGIDCILLDFRLPRTDGLTLLRELRADGIDVPVVMLTGQGDEQTAVEIMKAGAADYIAKAALSPERLARSLEHAVRTHRAERAARRYALQLQGLAEAAVAANAELSVDAVLHGIVSRARSILGAHIAVVHLLSDAGHPAMHVVAVSEQYAGARPSDVPLDDAAEATLRELRQPVRLTRVDLVHAPAGRALARVVGIDLADEDWLAAPLRWRDGRCLGVLHLSKKIEGEFEASDEAILVQLAQTAAVAVQNARLYEAAQAAARARDDMVAVVSHDLRNPLNTVLVTAALLEKIIPDDGTRAGERDKIARITRAATRMNRLISDLLDVTKIEAGLLTVAPEVHPVHPLIEDALDTLRPLATAKSLRLESDVAPALPAIFADRDRLLQVFSNVAGNAIKFTPEGGVVSVRAVMDTGVVRVEVSDTGPGIAHESLPRIFERHWQAPGSATLGTGLGLFIAKGIVEAHGGTIGVSSTPGVGTTFRFTIPVAAVGAVAPPAGSDPVGRVGPAGAAPSPGTAGASSIAG